MRKRHFLVIAAALGFAAISYAQTPQNSPLGLGRTAASSEGARSGSFLYTPCGKVLRQAWNLERNMENTYLSQTPATDARALWKKADEFNDGPLGDCEESTYGTDPALHEALLAESGNLAYIRNTELSTGGTEGFPEGAAGSFPQDLGDVAPACKPVLASALPQRIEALVAGENTTPAANGENASRLLEEAEPKVGAGLLMCARQAGDAGYKGVVIRLLDDELMLTLRVIVARN